jgi:hypothetical protein
MNKPVKKPTLPKLEEISTEKEGNNGNIASDKKNYNRKSSTGLARNTNSNAEEKTQLNNKNNLQIGSQQINSNLKEQNMANNSIIDIAGDLQAPNSKIRPHEIEQDSEENRQVDLAERISSSNVLIPFQNQIHNPNHSINLRMSQQSQKNDLEENFLSMDEKKKMMESIKSMLMNLKPNV